MEKLRICLSSLGLLVAVNAFAGGPDIVPNDKGSFFIGLTGMAAQPSETGIGLVTDSWQYQNGNMILAQSKPQSPRYNFAGGVDVGYNFADSANSVQFSYFGLYANSRGVFNGANAFSFGGVFFDAAFLNPGAAFVSDSRLKYSLSQFDLLLGHQFRKVWDDFSLKLLLGLRYATLQHNFPFAQPGYVISNFNGIGPLAGFDGRFRLGQSGFGIVEHLDAALLDGNVNARSNLFLPVAGNPISVYNFNSPTRNRIVTGLTGSIGFDYRYQFSDQSSLGLELGYKVAEYINAFDLIQATLFAGATNVSFGTPKIQNINTTSFSYQGPYLTLTFQF